MGLRFLIRDPAASRSLRALLAAGLSNAVAVLPTFLLGALAVLVRDELHFGEFQLGLAASVFAAASALLSPFGGRMSERLGPDRAMRLGGWAAALAMLGIGVAARSWWQLCAFLAVAGMANALVQPATNLALSRAIPVHRQGLAFGIKQAAVPAAGMAAGIAVPTLGLTVGWRWAFAAGALAAIAFGLVVPSAAGPVDRSRRGRNLRAGDSATRPLILLAGAVAFASTAASSMATFYVEAAVSSGISPQAAGLWLVAGGACGVVARIVYGWAADRREGGHLRFVSRLLVGGTLGYALLATGAPGIVLAAGTILAFVAGWGWPGLFVFAIVRHNRNAPAAATGITQAGVFVGVLVGPPAFGAIVEASGYPAAWLAGGAALLVSAVLMLVGRRVLLTDVARRSNPEGGARG